MDFDNKTVIITAPPAVSAGNAAALSDKTAQK